MCWAREAHQDLKDSSNQYFGNLLNVEQDAITLLIAKELIKQMQILLSPQVSPESKLLLCDEDDVESFEVSA